jgi:hypothetical protein
VYSNVVANQTNQNYTANVTISGNAGESGVTLSYINGTPKTVTTNAHGAYSFTVPYNWSGTVTPFKAGLTFTPANRTYTNVQANKTGQNYAAVLTSASNGAQDGSILETRENSNLGGMIDAATTFFKLGDDADNRQFRVILSFDTASLPDNAVIQSAVLKMKQNGAPIGSNPFSVLGKLWADIRKGPFGAATLQPGDFNASASAVKVGSFNPTAVDGWYTDTLNASGLSNLNKTGLTQLRLYFATDDNNNRVADFMKFLSGNAASGNKPTLIITYTVP